MKVAYIAGNEVFTTILIGTEDNIESKIRCLINRIERLINDRYNQDLIQAMVWVLCFLDDEGYMN